jgi:hypothetical protein
MRKSVPEAPGSVLEQAKPGLDERSISPRLALVLAAEAVERPIVPRAAVGPQKQATVAPFENVSEKQ